MKKELGILTLLLVLCGVTAFLNPRFLSGTNLTNMANIIGLYGVFSLGLGLIIITGGIDLSVGSMIALTGVILSIALTEWKWGWVASGMFVVAIAKALGLVHCGPITRAEVQPFLVTIFGLV